MKRIRLTQKGHNFFSVVAIIISMIFWLGLSGEGAFFQIMGLFATIASASWFCAKSSYFENIMNNMFGE